MAIVGGAIFPMIMGRIADLYSMSVGFIIPLLCFLFIFYFGIKGYKLQ
jgi:FHS family L-fucose permease-like MFS transporter